MISDEELFEQAKKASENAYCIYSKFPVGACVIYSSGNYYSGCNIENSSYGLSLCAERNAISTAIAMGEKSNISKIAIYSPERKLCFPCGACRQWLSEFDKGQNIEIILENENSKLCTYTLSEIMPYIFRINMI